MHDIVFRMRQFYIDHHAHTNEDAVRLYSRMSLLTHRDVVIQTVPESDIDMRNGPDMTNKCRNEMCTPPKINGRHDLLDQLFAAQSCMASQAKNGTWTYNCQSYMQRRHKREVAETECNAPDALQTS